MAGKRKRVPEVWVVFALLFAAPLHGQSTSNPTVRGVASIGITVSDMDQAVNFYSKVLSFEKVSDTEVVGEDYEHLDGVFGLRERVVRMKLGDEFVQLTEFLAPRGRPITVDSRSNDLWFQHVAIIVSNMKKAYSWLRTNHVEHASSGPQRLADWNRNAAGIWAFYFKDPDGHPLEILQFPPDKGLAKWHKATDKLFLGIDHTAIAVGDTARSLKFYRDALGLKVVGESENYGTEQEHLNNVFGARLHITSLRAVEGPGVELLEYLAPRDGRPYPGDERANDLVHRQTVFLSDDDAAMAQKLTLAGARFVSSGVVEISNTKLGYSRAFVVRDPDGHAVLIDQK